MYVVICGMYVSLTEASLCSEIKGWAWRGGIQSPAGGSAGGGWGRWGGEWGSGQAGRASREVVRVKDFGVRAMGRKPRIWVIL